jgi:hypothetical protein
MPTANVVAIGAGIATVVLSHFTIVIDHDPGEAVHGLTDAVVLIPVDGFGVVQTDCKH